MTTTIDAHPMLGEASHAAAMCGAKTRAGTPCLHSPVRGRNRCHLHGGRTLVGPASGTWKDGRHSKYLPTGLRDRYAEARSDPELLSLRDDIALTDTRTGDVLSRLDAGESGERWARLGRALFQLRQSVDADDVAGTRSALDRFAGIIESGTADTEAWAELGVLIDQRRRLVEGEGKRLTQMQQYITAERAVALVAAVAEAVKRHVTDRPTLAAISAELGALLAREPDQRTHAGDG